MFPIIETTSPTSTGRTSVGTGCSKCPDESTKREKKFEPTFLMAFASTRNDSRRYSFTSYDRFYGLLSDFYLLSTTDRRTDTIAFVIFESEQSSERNQRSGKAFFYSYLRRYTYSCMAMGHNLTHETHARTITDDMMHV
jgi:hypothetical protein